MNEQTPSASTCTSTIAGEYEVNQSEEPASIDEEVVITAGDDVPSCSQEVLGDQVPTAGDDVLAHDEVSDGGEGISLNHNQNQFTVPPPPLHPHPVGSQGSVSMIISRSLINDLVDQVIKMIEDETQRLMLEYNDQDDLLEEIICSSDKRRVVKNKLKGNHVKTYTNCSEIRRSPYRK